MVFLLGSPSLKEAAFLKFSQLKVFIEWGGKYSKLFVSRLLISKLGV
jgi:hypothetical protein